MFKKSRNIGSNKVFIFSKTNYKWTFFTAADNSVWIIFTDNTKSIRTFYHVKYLKYSLKNIFFFFIDFVYKMNYNFGICLRKKYRALSLKLSFDCGIVFDDSIMNYRNWTIHTCMGMRVCITWFSVSSPSCVSNTNRAFNSFISNFLFQEF